MRSLDLLLRHYTAQEENKAKLDVRSFFKKRSEKSSNNWTNPQRSPYPGIYRRPVTLRFSPKYSKVWFYLFFFGTISLVLSGPNNYDQVPMVFFIRHFSFRSMDFFLPGRYSFRINQNSFKLFDRPCARVWLLRSYKCTCSVLWTSSWVQYCIHTLVVNHHIYVTRY